VGEVVTGTTDRAVALRERIELPASVYEKAAQAIDLDDIVEHKAFGLTESKLYRREEVARAAVDAAVAELGLTVEHATGVQRVGWPPADYRYVSAWVLVREDH
jgi:hypothetical protein